MSNQQGESVAEILAKIGIVTARGVLHFGGGVATAAIAGTSVAAGIAVLGGTLWAANKLGLLSDSSSAKKQSNR